MRKYLLVWLIACLAFGKRILGGTGRWGAREVEPPAVGPRWSIRRYMLPATPPYRFDVCVEFPADWELAKIRSYLRNVAAALGHLDLARLVFHEFAAEGGVMRVPGDLISDHDSTTLQSAMDGFEYAMSLADRIDHVLTIRETRGVIADFRREPMSEVLRPQMERQILDYARGLEKILKNPTEFLDRRTEFKYRRELELAYEKLACLR